MEDIEWLMVHGANLAGVDKVSYTARKQWVKDNEERILATAADPLGFLWWAGMDSPYQFLAFCFEWERWLEYQKKHGTPKGFITGIPVAFDGTCSGLQHFSAMLRDPIGGEAVNLIPSDTPQDIYRLVAEKVITKAQIDAMKGTPDEEVTGKDGKTFTKLGTRTLAQQWLTFGIDRKVTKRSCMTLPYGSRQYGFADQLLEDIIKPAIAKGHGAMFVRRKQAARYMAKLIWDAVGTVVVKAVEGMEWLQKMARLVAKEGRVVTWLTPLGLPIQQSYLCYEPETIRLRFGSTIKRLYSYKPTGDVEKKKQASGVAPNFVHSMDAAHLQLTLVMAKEAGINHFAMIHDSYGAPVAQAACMFKVVREAFIQMYTENDVLENFKNDMEIYITKDEKIPALPCKGSLDINGIRDSLYTFA